MTFLNTEHRSKSRDVCIDDVNVCTPEGKELLVNSELRLIQKTRYGLIGRNGAGKSTLLRHISNYEIEGFPTFLRIMHVEQEVANYFSVICARDFFHIEFLFSRLLELTSPL